MAQPNPTKPPSEMNMTLSTDNRRLPVRLRISLTSGYRIYASAAATTTGSKTGSNHTKRAPIPQITITTNAAINTKASRLTAVQQIAR